MGALWPTIGIIIEAVLLVLIIGLYTCCKKSKSSRNDCGISPLEIVAFLNLFKNLTLKVQSFEPWKKKLFLSGSLDINDTYLIIFKPQNPTQIILTNIY